MILFKEYCNLIIDLINEVKASKNNIALFKKKYADSHYAYKAQMYQAEGDGGLDEDEFIEDMIDRFNNQKNPPRHQTHYHCHSFVQLKKLSSGLP